MKEEGHYLNFMDAYLDKEYLYAVSFEHIFFRAKRDGVYRVEILGIINEFLNKNTGAIYSVQYYQNSLYMFLDGTYEAARYDFNTKKFFYYYPAGHNDPFDGVKGSIRVGNDVWILRDTFEKKLCVFSLENGSYSFFELDLSVLSDNIEQEKLKFVPKEKICLVGNKVWRCVPGTDYLYSIDAKSKKLELYKTGADIEIFTINHDEDGFYLISMYGEAVIQWDEDKGVTGRRETDEKKRLKAFRDILRVDGGYMLLPGSSDKIRLLSEEEGSVRPCELPSQFRRIKGVKRGLFFNYYPDKDKVLLFPFGGNGLVEINKYTLESSYCPVCIPQEEYMKILLAGNQNIIESEAVSLNSYMSCIPVRRYTGEAVSSDNGTIGNQIMRKTKPKL